jgi:hypothetical protein
MGVLNSLLVAALVGGLIFLGNNYIRRWEERVNSAVSRYLTEQNQTPNKRPLQMLCDAVGLTLRNNFELSAVRRRIRKRGLPDPANSSEILKRGNLYKFLKFARKNNLRLDKPGSVAAATMQYKGLLSDKINT